MARYTLSDWNNHLFAQLERLSDEELAQEQLDKEIERSKAINVVAKNIIENARTALSGVRFASEQLPEGRLVPEQFRIKPAE